MSVKVMSKRVADKLFAVLQVLVFVTMMTSPVWGTELAGHHDDDNERVTDHLTDHDLLRQVTLCAADRTQLLGIAHSCMQDTVALRGNTQTLQEALNSLLQEQTHEQAAMGEQFAQVVALVMDLQVEYVSLQRKLKDMRTDNGRMQKAWAGLKESYTALEDDFLHLKARHGSLRGAHRSLEADHHQLRHRHEHVVNEHTSLEAQHAGLGREHSDLQHRHQRLVQEHRVLENQHADVSRELAALQQSHKTLLQEHGKLRSVYERNQETLQHSKEENGRLSSGLYKSRQEVTVLHKERDKAKAVIGNFLRKKDAWTNAIIQQQQQVQERMKQQEYMAAKLHKENNGLRKELEDLKEEKKDDKITFQNKVETCEDEKRNIVKEKEGKVNDLLREQDSLLEVFGKLEKTTKSLLQENEELRSTQQRSVEILHLFNDENVRLRSAFREMQGVVTFMHREREQAKAFIDNFVEKKNAWVNAMEELQHQEEERMKQLEDTTARLHKENTELRKEIDDLKQERDEYEIIYRHSRAEMDKMSDAHIDEKDYVVLEEETVIDNEAVLHGEEEVHEKERDAFVEAEEDDTEADARLHKENTDLREELDDVKEEREEYEIIYLHSKEEMNKTSVGYLNEKDFLVIEEETVIHNESVLQKADEVHEEGTHALVELEDDTEADTRLLCEENTDLTEELDDQKQEGEQYEIIYNHIKAQMEKTSDAYIDEKDYVIIEEEIVVHNECVLQRADEVHENGTGALVEPEDDTDADARLHKENTDLREELDDQKQEGEEYEIIYRQSKAEIDKTSIGYINGKDFVVIEEESVIHKEAVLQREDEVHEKGTHALIEVEDDTYTDGPEDEVLEKEEAEFTIYSEAETQSEDESQQEDSDNLLVESELEQTFIDEEIMVEEGEETIVEKYLVGVEKNDDGLHGETTGMSAGEEQQDMHPLTLEYLPQDDVVCQAEEEESQCAFTDDESDDALNYEVYEHTQAYEYIEEYEKPLKDTSNGVREIFTGYDMTRQREEHLLHYIPGGRRQGHEDGVNVPKTVK